MFFGFIIFHFMYKQNLVVGCKGFYFLTQNAKHNPWQENHAVLFKRTILHFSCRSHTFFIFKVV